MAGMNEGGSSALTVQFHRRFDVVETKRAPQGHTVYKLVCVTSNSSGEPLAEISFWRRYSAFVHLHKQLDDLYSSLQPSARNEKFPDFPKASFFGRFDDSVIDERRQGAVVLLQFVCGVPELLHSSALAEFFLHCGTVSKAQWTVFLSGASADPSTLVAEKAEFHPSFAVLCEKSAEISVSDANDLAEDSDARTSPTAAHLPDLQSSPNAGIADAASAPLDNPADSDCQPDCQPSIITDAMHSSKSSSGSDVGNAAAAAAVAGDDTSIWEHKCVSPVLDSAPEDTAALLNAASVVIENGGGADASGADDGHVGGAGHDGDCVSKAVALGLADGTSADNGDVEEDAEGTGNASALLADLSMIDDQLERSEEVEGTLAEDPNASIDDLPSGLASPPLSEPHTPPGSESPGMCLTSNPPVARIYSSPGGSNGSWFKDAVATSWDDIERQLGDEDAGNSRAVSSSPPGQSSMASTAVGASDLSSSSNDRAQPVAQLSSSTGSGVGREQRMPGRTHSVDSVSGIELSGDGDYVLQSAAVIGKALEAEAASDFALAFSLYKSGVGLLLSGVQTDSNALRRDAVRRKTAQYLQRAETLHHRYLKNSAETNKDRWQDTPRHAAPVVLTAPVAPNQQMPALQLRDFAVMRPLGRLLLARNRHTQDVYVMKTLCKALLPLQPSGKRSRVRSRNLISTLCPYMIRPVGHFDTPNRVFLLLEYAQRGALWSTLDRFYEEVLPKGSRSSETAVDADGAAESDGADANSPLRAAWTPGESREAAGVAVPEGRVRRWAAQIVSALHHLHCHSFVWRDLQPWNLLLDEQDDILLTYNGHWENVDRQFSLWARENLYIAPELNGLAKETEAADWWSLGAILYELLTGKTLVSCHPAGVSSHSSLYLPAHLSFQASSLLQNLLQPSCKERLGAGHSGIEEIKSHPFFAGVQWTNSR